MSNSIVVRISVSSVVRLTICACAATLLAVSALVGAFVLTASIETARYSQELEEILTQPAAAPPVGAKHTRICPANPSPCVRAYIPLFTSNLLTISSSKCNRGDTLPSHSRGARAVCAPGSTAAGCGVYTLAPQVPLFAAPPTPYLSDPNMLPPRSTSLNAELFTGAEVRGGSAPERYRRLRAAALRFWQKSEARAWRGVEEG